MYNYTLLASNSKLHHNYCGTGCVAKLHILNIESTQNSINLKWQHTDFINQRVEMESTSTVREWLKTIFRETGDSPQPKFSEMSDEIFPQEKFSPYAISRIVHETFPNIESKVCGKARQKHLLGLERRSSASTSVEPDVSTTKLQAEIDQLKKQVAELERKSDQVLCHQADEVIYHASAVTQGPTSLEGFRQFDLDSIISELRFRAPDLYQLFMTLGDTQRHQEEEEEVTTENVKAVSALCSTLNARSARSKGLQLLLGMMLIARGTSRQVGM